MVNYRISSFGWYGGKNRKELQNGLAQTIPISTKTFIECCAGSAALSLNKACHNQKMVLNDVDPSIINLFAVWKSESYFKAFRKAVYNIKVDKENFLKAKEIDKGIKSFESPNIEQAVATYTVITQSFNAARSQFRNGVNQYMYTKRVTRNLVAVHQRLQRIRLENKDLMDMIETYGKEESNTLYLDVPYIHFTRGSSARNVYRAEMSYKDHENMLNRLAKDDIKALIIISNYMPDDNSTCAADEDLHIYDNTLLKAGWFRYLLSVVVNCSSSKKQQKEEWIWVNKKLSQAQKMFLCDPFPYYMNEKGEICHEKP